LCGRCGEQLGGAHGRGPFLRAAALGGGAALLGTIVWFAILKFSGREFGLLAIGVGLGRVLLAIASSGAFINLFNLVPVWQLDGGRGFAALTQRQRSVVAGLLWVLALVVGEGMLVVLAVACTARALIKGNAPEQGDNEVQMTYLGLVLGLTFLMLRAKP
jgi:Zn-dependent protease